MSPAPCPWGGLMIVVFAVWLPEARGQSTGSFTVMGANVQKRADAVLSLMAYSVTPDLASSSLSIGSATSGNPGIVMSQVGAGFTVSSASRVYLEGFAGYSRYDPTFVATRGQERDPVSTQWTTVAGTGGIGWDVPVPWVSDLTLRPIFNASLGHVTSELTLLGRFVDLRRDLTVEFLDNGHLNAYGLGGSLMLDYESYRETRDIDVELRYTNILLQSFASSSGVEGDADAQTLSLYLRWRAPTGIVMLRRPLRYVLEGASSTYLGSQGGVLGFNYLSSVGAGIEFDTSAIHLVVTRVRFVLRYAFGENVSGVSGGFAVTLF